MKNSQNQRRIYIFSLIMLSESTLGIGFCVLDFLSILSDFLLQETLTQKRLEPKAKFAKLQLLNDKIDQYTNFEKLPSAKWLFFYKFPSHFYCSAFGSCHFCVSSRERKSERIERKLKTQNPNQRLLNFCSPAAVPTL